MSKTVIAISVGYVITMLTAAFACNVFGIQIQEVIIYSAIGYFGIEGGYLAWIKTVKTKKNNVKPGAVSSDDELNL